MRTRTQGRAEALPMIGAAMTMRLYWGMSLDFPAPQNAVWLCPLVGLLLYLPFALALRAAAGLGGDSIWGNLAGRTNRVLAAVLAALFALMLLWDAAAAMGLTALSSNILALDDVSPRLLLLPLALMVLLAIQLGAPALGLSARLWLRVLPLFALVILLVQFGNYKIGWLTPILGGGAGSILDGGIYCAGCMALMSLPWLIAVPDVRRGGLLPCAALSAVAASLILLSQRLLLPAMVKSGFTTVARIDLMLNNGRMTLSPQIVLDVLWFGNMLHLICAEAVTAAEYLRAIWPRLPLWPLAGGCALAVWLASALGGERLRLNPVASLNPYVLAGAALALLMLISYFRKGGERA